MVARKTKGEGIKGISDKWELFARGHVSSPIPHLDFREFPTKKATKPQGFKPQNNFFFFKAHMCSCFSTITKLLFIHALAVYGPPCCFLRGCVNVTNGGGFGAAVEKCFLKILILNFIYIYIYKLFYLLILKINFKIPSTIDGGGQNSSPNLYKFHLIPSQLSSLNSFTFLLPCTLLFSPPKSQSSCKSSVYLLSHLLFYMLFLLLNEPTKKCELGVF
jgi:hypothetical protein